MRWDDIRYFQPKEFESPDDPGSGDHMEQLFVEKLDLLREACGFPLIINSGYRTAFHNERVKGKENSAHRLGLAADIRANRSRTRFRIVDEALRLGFTRIGVGKTFVHVDFDLSKPQAVMWLYD